MGKTRDLFKKIRDTKGTFHAKTGSIKDRNGMDLTEAEDIKKRWQEYWSGLPFPSPGDHSQPRDWTLVSCTAGKFFTDWATREALVEADVFLELFCFFYDPMDVGNLISGSSAVSKSSLNIWKFTVHVLLKPGLENFLSSLCYWFLVLFHCGQRTYAIKF